ncbi:MAG: hypothetical protein ACJ8EY_10665 [Sphingomicrobium sp.]
MATVTTGARTPTSLWIVGALAVLWNAYGAYDYLMTRMRNVEYLRSAMPSVDPQAMLDYVDAMPIFAQFGWGLGVWMGLAGALLLLARSRFAVHAFALSLLGIVLSIGYSLTLAPPPPAGADEGIGKFMPYVVIVVGIALLVFARSMQRKGALR